METSPHLTGSGRLRRQNVIFLPLPEVHQSFNPTREQYPCQWRTWRIIQAHHQSARYANRGGVRAGGNPIGTSCIGTAIGADIGGNFSTVDGRFQGDGAGLWDTTRARASLRNYKAVRPARRGRHRTAGEGCFVRGSAGEDGSGRCHDGYDGRGSAKRKR